MFCFPANFFSDAVAHMPGDGLPVVAPQASPDDGTNDNENETAKDNSAPAAAVSSDAKKWSKQNKKAPHSHPHPRRRAQPLQSFTTPGSTLEYPAPLMTPQYAVPEDPTVVKSAIKSRLKDIRVSAGDLGRHGAAVATSNSAAAGANAKAAASNPLTNSLRISEGLDHGHRHFSAMHWVYPGTFHPIGRAKAKAAPESASIFSKPGVASVSLSANGYDVDAMYRGAKIFMRDRVANGGAHTSWSSAWAACIFARLLDADAALSSLQKLLTRYASPNLLSLHPPLMKFPEECSTCFVEQPMTTNLPSGVDARAAENRGMVTGLDHKVRSI
jgi:hypothetical protein